MAGIVGSPDFDSYLHSQKLPSLNSSFHHDLYFMYSWDWTLAEIRYCLCIICHQLQAFKICGGQELARCYGGTKVSFPGTSTAVDAILSYSLGFDLLLPIFSFDF